MQRVEAVRIAIQVAPRSCPGGGWPASSEIPFDDIRRAIRDVLALGGARAAIQAMDGDVNIRYKIERAEPSPTLAADVLELGTSGSGGGELALVLVGCT